MHGFTSNLVCMKQYTLYITLITVFIFSDVKHAIRKIKANLFWELGFKIGKGIWMTGVPAISLKEPLVELVDCSK